MAFLYVKISPDQDQKLNNLAERKGVYVSELVKQAIDDYVARMEREAGSGDPKVIRTQGR